MYSPRLYKYRDSYVLYKPAVHLQFGITYTQSFGTDTHNVQIQRFLVLYKPAVHTFGSVSLAHTLLVQTHIHVVSVPDVMWISILFRPTDLIPLPYSARNNFNWGIKEFFWYELLFAQRLYQYNEDDFLFLFSPSVIFEKGMLEIKT